MAPLGYTVYGRATSSNVQALIWCLEELAKAEPRLEQKAFLCGQSLTLADIQFGHVLFRYFDFQQQSDARDRLNLTDLPALRRYYSRLSERPAYQKAVMVSYETLRNTF